jgi:hypothetical protein
MRGDVDRDLGTHRRLVRVVAADVSTVVSGDCISEKADRLRLALGLQEGLRLSMPELLSNVTCEFSSDFRCGCPRQVEVDKEARQLWQPTALVEYLKVLRNG